VSVGGYGNGLCKLILDKPCGFTIQLSIDRRGSVSWTEEKNQLNKKKHGLYLSEVVDVFDDPHLLEFYDTAHSSLDEDRYITLGRLRDMVILFVVTTDKVDNNTQIITARKATPNEKEIYYAHYEKET
jgi:uncharacterized DUF497 family protein